MKWQKAQTNDILSLYHLLLFHHCIRLNNICTCARARACVCVCVFSTMCMHMCKLHVYVCTYMCAHVGKCAYLFCFLIQNSTEAIVTINQTLTPSNEDFFTVQ